MNNQSQRYAIIQPIMLRKQLRNAKCKYFPFQLSIKKKHKLNFLLSIKARAFHLLLTYKSNKIDDLSQILLFMKENEEIPLCFLPETDESDNIK